MRANSQSKNPRNTPITAARAMTRSQSLVASSREGQVTLRSSPKTSPKKPNIEKRLDGVSLTSGLARFCAMVFCPSTGHSKDGQRLRSRNWLWDLHAGQYLRRVMRSGVLRRFFSV